ncbi:MAG: UDP-N-acetylmuramate--L-alanine ligase [Actinomycetota bacterium]
MTPNEDGDPRRPASQAGGRVGGYVPPPGSIPTLAVPDLAGVRSTHLVGIGGAGMSGLARLLLAGGIAVSGSDLKDTKGLVQLRALGAAVHVGHRAEHIGDAETVAVSSAIPPDNPEVVEARRRGIPVYARAQVLAALMAERRGVAVAGTHGKTTTTSMLAVILERSGRDPTYIIGGDLNESGSNARWGSGELFVAEADESDGSFLLLSPEIAIVTNVEPDHLDFFGTAAQVEAAFATFCRRAGRLVVCGDDPGASRVAGTAGVEVTTYGEGGGSDVLVDRIEVGPAGSRCRLRFEGQAIDVRLQVPGRHHLVNAAGALAAARLAGVGLEEGAAALARFTGVRRRFERRGRAGGAEFVDDYAHHPTEIAATLTAARAGGPRRVVAVFQPHRYTRTAVLWRALGESLAGADVVVLTDVYGAGEVPMPGITGKLLVDALLERSPRTRAVYLPHRSTVARFLSTTVREGDLVLTLGAGDITMVGEETLTMLGGDHGR